MIESIQHRRSIRKFTSNPIEPEKIQSMLEAGRLAPSGNNKQPWNFIVIQSEQQRQAVMEVCHRQTWMMTAKAFIVAVADMAARVETEPGLYLDETSPHWELKRAIRDTAIAIENMLLEADAQGLGTCWVGFFVQSEIRPVLGIPDDKFVVAVIPIGYPAEQPPARPRKPLSEIVRYEKW
jgi:nitroreductase